MAIRYKNPQTGEYEVIKIPVMKGEQGHAGIHVGTDAPPTTDVKLWFDPSDTDNDVDLANRLDATLTACYDYMGNDRGSIKAAADANVDWLLGEINTVHYDGQYITATDTIEGRSKSAILKGQTLVNYFPEYTKTMAIGTGNWRVIFNGKINIPLTPNTSYLFINNSNVGKKIHVSVIGETTAERNVIANLTTNIAKFTTPDTTDNFSRMNVYLMEDNTSELTYDSFMVIPYQDGMENWDIPYFTGMQSVRMPVLTTTGKNLWNTSILNSIPINNYYESTGLTLKELCPDLVVGETYIASMRYEYTGQITGTVGVALIPFLDITHKPFTYTDDLKDSRVYIYGGNATGTAYDFQIEKGTVATSYEPFKSNILTCNEEVELRGIGDVKDELDLLTGEKIHRVEEITLDGSSSIPWRTTVDEYENVYRFYLMHNDVTPNSKMKGHGGGIICDKIPAFVDYDGLSINMGNSWGIILCVPKNELSSYSVSSLRQWLAQNPVTAQYVIAEGFAETTNLSDHHVYSYQEITHYTCSSEEGLIPTLSIDVPTNLSALVTKQRNQIETLKEENKELNQELELAITSSEESDNELLAQSFELDFRLMEVEFALDLPMAATFRLGGKTMAMTPYEMAKKLILADNYDRADMEHKLDVYVSKKRMTEAERQELIQLMDEKEGVITIDPVEPEVEESIIEHEAVTIPLH